MKIDEPRKQEQIRISLKKKAVIAELEKYDELTYTSYKELAHKTLLQETGAGTKNSRSHWIKYKNAFYP